MVNRKVVSPVRLGSLVGVLALSLFGCDTEVDVDSLGFDDEDFRAGTGGDEPKDQPNKKPKKCKDKQLGSGGGELPCTFEGCACEGPADCDLGLVCSEGSCSVPLSTCGDGIVEGPEQCDDGNLRDDDGCDSDCSPTKILDLSAGSTHNCVLLGHGGVRCWGYHGGRLGRGSLEHIGDDEPASATSNVPLAKPALAVSAGTTHTCAVVEGGEVMCWGDNVWGSLGYGHKENLGDNETLEALTRVWLGAPAVGVFAGYGVSCAHLESNDLLCWGTNSSYMLGIGQGTSVQIGDDERPFQSQLVSLGEPAAQLSVGNRSNHACVLTEAGTVRCWGNGSSGQLGYGDKYSKSKPYNPVLAIAQGLPPDTQVTSVSVGTNNTCVTYSTGDATCWGSNSSGSLGRANTVAYSTFYKPNQLPPIDFGGATIVDIAVGYGHICARTDTGGAYCFGRNNQGQLGYGHTQNIGDNETPAQAGPVDTGGVAIRKFAMGVEHTCVWLEDESIRCLGDNNYGQLGYGNTTDIVSTFAEVDPVPLF